MSVREHNTSENDSHLKKEHANIIINLLLSD